MVISTSHVDFHTGLALHEISLELRQIIHVEDDAPAQKPRELRWSETAKEARPAYSSFWSVLSLWIHILICAWLSALLRGFGSNCSLRVSRCWGGMTWHNATTTRQLPFGSGALAAKEAYVVELRKRKQVRMIRVDR